MSNQAIILFMLMVAAVAPSHSFTLSGAHRLQHRMTLTATADLHEPIVNLFNQFQHADIVGSLQTSILIADEDTAAAVEKVADAAAQVSLYSKVDKTGFIGGIASAIETVITFFHETLQKVGLENSYGVSIILFTMLVKILTLPLNTAQIESTTKMQKLTPLQQKIQAKYSRPEDEQTKNQLIAQLFQAASVNPLAGCLPAFAQIPIFLSLYRALQNLIAEDKLEEPFLWVPNLEGPVFMKPPGESLDWIKSVFTGNPELGWQATLAYFSLPFILFVSQSISTRVLQPPKDPNRVMSDQELTTQGIINNLPFIVAFFSLNVPAGLGLYWIVNNILTTAITLSIKARFKDEPVPAEVSKMMAAIDADTGVGASSRTRATSSAAQELGRGMGSKMSEEDRERLRKFEERSGFGKAQSQSPQIIDVNPIASVDSSIPVPSSETSNASTDVNSLEPKGPLGKTLKFINEKMREEDVKTTEQQNAINKEIDEVVRDKKSKRKGKNKK